MSLKRLIKSTSNKEPVTNSQLNFKFLESLIPLSKKGGKSYPGVGTKDDCYYKAVESYGTTSTAYRSGFISKCRKKKLNRKSGGVVRKGGELNQGSKPMEFILTEKDSIQKHTLDGYKLDKNKFVRDVTKSIPGYLKPISKKESEGLKQYGDNLYSKMEKGGTFDKEQKEGLRGWFSRNNGKGWVNCEDGTPCGGEKAGSKRLCRPTLADCPSKAKLAQLKKKKVMGKSISWTD